MKTCSESSRDVVLDTTVVVAALVAEGLCREVVHRAVRVRVLASIIVTGDDHLLVLGRHSGLEILAPRRFLEQLDASKT